MVEWGIGPGSNYATVAKRLCVLAGKPDAFSDVVDHVDIAHSEAWLKYKVGGTSLDIKAKVDGHWVDAMVVHDVMFDLEYDRRSGPSAFRASNEQTWRFYGRDNGSAKVLFYLDDEAAAAVNRWSGNALHPLMPE